VPEGKLLRWPDLSRFVLKSAIDEINSNCERTGFKVMMTATSRINPKYALAFYNRSIDKQAIGDYTSATADFNKALALNPNLPKPPPNN
jgi:tetratricopeptide (TPR) repeat protein